MIRWIFLDLDDTILDFKGGEANAIRKTFSHVGLDPTDALVARYSAINMAQWEALERGELTREQVHVRRFEILFRELGCSASPEEASAYYMSALAAEHSYLPGGRELLDALHGKYLLYLASNGTLSVQTPRIADSGVGRYFEAMFISEEVGAVKPTKAFFDACFASIPDFQREDAVILGDSLTSDILGGIHAGIRTCWFNPKGKTGREDIRPDAEIRDLSQFPLLLEQWNQQ
ncbi:MAG: YjjG family noncanonical pyrimidine nucleotidase [Clostridia bacterium]|nr:YjjG family noncanonical pyrimidine nucleotidase [Clostridia bacterium]MBQ5833596.1 YjjG family noncanonical pyrimidine nucleotidase [Clostridia bacterium]